jgi:CheY-like chemotaxis protein
MEWGRIRNPFQILRDAREAIKYLTGEGKFGDRAAFPRPGAIILDLYLPGMSGLEFLQWLHEHPQYRVVPTIVVTTSDRESDMQKAYNLGAHAYLVKPLLFDDLVPEIKSTLAQWSA